jgi:hypothetical protein
MLPTLTQSSQGDTADIQDLGTHATQWFENEDAQGSSDVDIVDDDPTDLSMHSNPICPLFLTYFIAYHPTQGPTQASASQRVSPRRSGISISHITLSH